MAKTKAFRLDDELREAFEQFCEERVLNQTEVVEALFLRWLTAAAPEQIAIISNYVGWKRAGRPAPKTGEKWIAPDDESKSRRKSAG